MATSPETFNQVKNILRKLDRSIDDIRSRRGTPPPAAATTGTIGGPSAVSGSGQLTANMSVPPGRARPMNRDPRSTF